MTYRTFMVRLDLYDGSEAALRVTSDLAGRFGARVIGIASAYPTPPIHAEGMIATSIVEADFDQLRSALAACESRFRHVFRNSGSAVEWRSEAAIPVEFLAAEARAADLLIVDRALPPGLLRPPNQSLDMGDAVMKAGRPIIVVPPHTTCLPLNRALVAWKDTVEARRALSAALPLLEKTQDVWLVEIVADDDETVAAGHRLEDVTKWLERHGIRASSTVALSAGDVGAHLNLIAEQNGIEVIVTGAYGHSRLQEWVFGGVTRHLLQECTVCAFMLH
jgi:nucleotide-binding universal stress UspA family protein